MDKYPKYISEEEQELFERFLLGEMPVEEKVSFKARLADNKQLHKSFEEFKSLFETVEEEGFRNKLDDFHIEVQNNDETSVKKLNPSNKWFNYRIAASVAFLLAIGSLWFFNQASPNEKLFDQYYMQDPGLPTVMGSSDNYDFYEAMVDYKQGNYDVAIGKWEKLLETKPENDTINYFLGTAYLAKEKHNEAISFFENTVQASPSNFDKEAYFYLGLIYMKHGDQEKAIELLGLSELKNAKELHQELSKIQK